MNFKFLFIAFLFFSSGVAHAQMAHQPGELLIQFSPKSFPEKVMENYVTIHSLNTGIVLEKCLSKPMNIYKVEFNPEKVNENFLLEMIRKDSNVLNAQFNHTIKKRETTPDDPQLLQQWHHINNGTNGIADADIDSDQAWDITTGGLTALGDTIVVCVIEGGNLLHTDLIDNAWFNHNEIPNNGIDDDNNGYVDDYRGWNVNSNSDGGLYGDAHGTNVMGMIGATGNNNLGTVGINWHVKIMAVGGENEDDEASVVAAYTYPLVQRQLYESTNGESGAFVVVTNASWGIDNGNPADVPIWAAFYDTLGTYGILNCGATANNNVNIDVVGDIPTAVESDYMISVTATNSSDERTFSGFGQHTIDLGAPGDHVVTSSGQNGITSTSGTSFASPLTAGVVALLYAAPCEGLAQLAHDNPQLCADYVRHALLTGVDPVENLEFETVTGGRLNAFNSLNFIMESCANGFCIPPLNFDYVVINDTIFTFSWDLSENLAFSSIRYREIGDEEWVYISNITTQSEQINGLAHCANYEFEIAGICEGEPQESDFGSHTTIHTAGCCVIPDDVTVSSTEDLQLILSWTQDLDIHTYLVRYQVEGDTTWTTAGSGSNFYAFTDLEECQTYNFWIIPTCFFALDSGAVITVTTSGCGHCIDTEFCTSASESAFYEFIKKVQIGDYENNSGNNGGYAFFSDTGLELVPGDDYEVTFTPGFSGFGGYDEFFSVWIDIDQNGIFSEDEKVYQSDFASNLPSIGEMTIPSGAILGPNRMRVAMKELESGDQTPTPCETYDYGETEDYCITLVDTVSVVSNPDKLAVFELFPNPGNGQITLNFEANQLIGNGNYSVSILDLMGKEVAQRSVVIGKNSLSLRLSSGLYLLQLKASNGNVLKSEKLVVTD